MGSPTSHQEGKGRKGESIRRAAKKATREDIIQDHQLGGGRMNPAEALTPDPNGFLTKRELAVRLKMTVRSVENWQKRGILPYLKIGKVVRFHWPEVIQHLKANYRFNRRVRLPEVPV